MRFLEPRIRTALAPYTRFQWQVERAELLPPAQRLDDEQERRSRREFNAPLMTNLSTLLWHSARCQEVLPAPAGLDLQLRPLPSAGAIHPIHLLIEHPEARTWARYDPRAHSLEHLSDVDSLAMVRATAAEYVDPGDGITLVFVAEPGLTEAKYEDAASLVWRDAGVLQGAIALLAPQAGLACCLLGLTADRFVAPLSKQHELVGVGTAILGTPR